MSRIRGGFVLSLSLSVAAPAMSQAVPDAATSSPTSGTRRFTPTDFAQFDPVSALEMVRRVPGFSIAQDDGKRGFGDSAGNVLIDGDRPSSKSDDIFTILSRIPANQIEYIELTESAGGDGELRGRAQIVNVVRKKSNKLNGTYEVAAAVGEVGGFAPFASGSLAFRRGASDIELNAKYLKDEVFGKGPEDFFDGAHHLIERRYYNGHGGFEEASFGGKIKTKMGGTKLNANGKIGWKAGFDNRLGAITNPQTTRIGTEDLQSIGPDWDLGYEIGGDVEFPLGKKLTSKVIGLWGREKERSGTTVDTTRVGLPLTSFAVANDAAASEGVLRVQNDWSGIKQHSIQFGIEFAYNQLRSSLVQSNNVGGALTLIPASNVLVTEKRLEPFVSDVWSISPKWKLEAGLVFEASTLRLTGDSRANRSLQFAKPRLVGTWTINKKTSMEFRAEREVAQLDFGDFATSIDLSAGNQVGAGNADLVPEQTTTFSAILRHKFMSRGSIQLQGNYVRINDTQDLIPVYVRDAAGNVVASFDGVGNIGKSTRWDAEAEITLPFAWLGIPGLEVKWVAHYHNSRVTDPVTGLHRRMSHRPLWHQDWDLRHDIGKTGFAWGMRVFAADRSDAYFINQIRYQAQQPQFNIFVEYKKFKYGTLKFEVLDATESSFFRKRHFFQGTRASNVLTSFIERERRLDRRYQVSLSGKF